MMTFYTITRNLLVDTMKNPMELYVTSFLLVCIAPPYEGLDDVNEIVKCIVKAIKYFKKRDNEIRLKRINDDF